MDIESARLLSPPVRAMRARIIAFMLESTYMGCLDLSDVFHQLKSMHVATSFFYVSRGELETVQGLGFVVMENVPNVSVDYHHMDFWAEIVETMSQASRAYFYNNFHMLADPAALPTSPEYLDDRRRRDEFMNGVISDMVNDFKSYFARYPSDGERITNMGELYAIGDRILGPERTLPLAHFHRACAMRREAGDDDEARSVWQWFSDHTIFGSWWDREGLVDRLGVKIEPLRRALPAV